MSHFLSFVLFSEASPVITTQAIPASARRLRPAPRIEAQGSQDGKAQMFLVDGVHCVFIPVPAPIPDPSLAAAAAGAYWWPEAPQAVQRHRGHGIVAAPGAAAGSPADKLRAARSVTLLCAAIAGATPAALAVQWTDSTVIHPASRLAALAAQDVPADLWFDIRLVREPSGQDGLVLRGMRPFAGREIVVAPSSLMPLPQLAERALGFATYLVKGGAAINDGDTIGISPQEAIRVRLVNDPRVGGAAFLLTVERPQQ